MDRKEEDNNSWFKNINKSDTGTQVYVIPVLSKTDQVVITSSSNYSNNPVMNATDDNPQTKWVSNYKMRTYKDNFYTNRNISTGSYSRGKIVDDGKNRQIVKDNEHSINVLRNQTNVLNNQINVLRNRINVLNNEIKLLNNERDKQIKNANNSKIQIGAPRGRSEFTTITNIHIGNSGSNLKQVPLNDTDLNVVNSNISNRFGDRFNVWIVNYLMVRRIDRGGGWGDYTLRTPLINGVGREESVLIGSSNVNTKGVPLPDRKMRIKTNYIGNSAGDRFYIYTQTFLNVQRTDYGGGWGDKGLHAPLYKPDTTAYERYINKRNENISHNTRVDKIIKGINRDTDAKIATINTEIATINTEIATINNEIATINTEIANIPKIDVNSLPVNITDDGKYTGATQVTLINNSIIKGEWIDVNVPDTITINRYALLPGRRDDNPEQLTQFPKDFYLLGSNNKDKWNILDSHFDYTPAYSDNNTPIMFDINNKQKYKYIRLVISSLNPAYTGFKGLGSVSLSIFNLSGNQCYSINKTSCETFQSYINNTNMSNIEGLTIMNENIQVLADLKNFNEKYNKYIKCSDITLPDNIKQQCTAQDKDIQSVNNAYSQLMDNGSIQSLQLTPLNLYSTTTEYTNMKTHTLNTHNQIVPLRQELDKKLKDLMDDKQTMTSDYNKKYENTMSTSLVLSVILTSSLYFIFKNL